MTLNKLRSTLGAVGPGEYIVAGVAKPHLSVDRPEGADIEVLRLRSDVAEDLYRTVLHLVGELQRRARRVQHVGV